MALRDDIANEVEAIFRSPWKVTEGRVIPSPNSLTLGNDGISLDATVLYADLRGSTQLVDTYHREFAAEVYNAFLRTSARLIRFANGAITAYDGDRVMAVFLGDKKNNEAVRTALRIQFACIHILQPAIDKQYPNSTFKLGHVVGIDTSSLMISKTGVWGANDLLWMGKASNHAAKLCDLKLGYSTWITAAVYQQLWDAHKMSSGNAMWKKWNWNEMNNAEIYSSNYWWRINE